MNYLIPEHIWQCIYKYLSSYKGLHTTDELRLRIFLEAIYYILKTGCQWRMLHTDYGHWRSIHQKFIRWSRKGIWENLFNTFQIDPDMELIMIDSTTVRAHSCASGYRKNSSKEQALGRSSGGLTTKIHTVVDALGNPLKYILSPGQTHDRKLAEDLLHNYSNVEVLADKGYDCNKLVEFLKDRNCNSTIPSKRNRKKKRCIDKHVYKERHLIECFFGKIKHFRRVFSRFDKTSIAFSAFISLVNFFV